MSSVETREYSYNTTQNYNIWNYEQRLNKLENTLDEVRKENNTLKTGLEIALEKLKDLSNCMKENKSLKEDNESLKERNFNLETDNASKKNLIDIYKKKIAENDKDLDSLRTTLNNVKIKSEADKNEIIRLTNLNKQQDREINELKSMNKNEKSTPNCRMKKELENVSKRATDAENCINEKDGTIRDLQTKNERLVNEKNELSASLEAAADEERNLQNHITEKDVTIRDLQIKNGRLVNEKNELSASLEAAAGAERNLQNSINEKDGTISDLRDLLNAANNRADDAERLLQSFKDKFGEINNLNISDSDSWNRWLTSLVSMVNTDLTEAEIQGMVNIIGRDSELRNLRSELASSKSSKNSFNRFVNRICSFFRRRRRMKSGGR